MVGITLNPEQIRTAPPEVRQWLENEIAHSLGIGAAPQPVPLDTPHLAACSQQEAQAIYASIRGMLPVVSVFLELGRKGTSIAGQSLEAFRLSDMLHNARLPDERHLAACLEVIDHAFRLAHKDDHAVLSVIDPRGYCIVAEGTRRSILGVWMQEMAAQQFLDGAMSSDVPIPQEESFSTSGTLPPRSIHLGQSFSESAAATDGP
ncbi:hypothetical protein RFM41_15885 [Mesorhizobium sp. VK25A]|uniref:Roadblock/LAMTOR2 domain-containing protein n=1 Tax=Mesorhizobium vachelliae TaxID=3072309 RepID=A0ABU5A6W2_9HYPH|nr:MULTISPECIES: hypothetical protein [unclassified Mesorhizobium]MDX8533312.1 hypothetical protein [Mesorhizobium sp. VK25D]MDX8545231.1 hypothetical protein [Mesorhizobium sp. VK25A]